MVLGDSVKEVNHLFSKFCQIWKIYDILMAVGHVNIIYNERSIEIDSYFIRRNNILYLIDKAQYYLKEINQKLVELSKIRDINASINFQMDIQDYVGQEDVKDTYNSIISVFEKLDMIV